MDEFTPEEIVAIAGAIKGTREKAAKDALREQFVAQVDFIVRITGHVQKGQSTPGGKITRPAVVHLDSVPVFCAVLRELGIGAKRLAKALLAIDPLTGADSEFDAIFADAAAFHAKSLPAVETTTTGKAATVTSSIDLARM